MKVGIAGVGGIGSNVARLLAQAQVKTIKIVDFDTVEISNLNRQFYLHSQQNHNKTLCLKSNLQQIYPAMTVETVNHRIAVGDCKELFGDCEIVVEGFDDKHMKKLLLEELAETRTVVVSASGIAGRQMDSISAKQLGHCHIVGDFLSDQDEMSIFPPKIAMITAMMASIVLQQIEELENV